MYKPKEGNEATLTKELELATRNCYVSTMVQANFHPRIPTTNYQNLVVSKIGAKLI